MGDYEGYTEVNHGDLMLRLTLGEMTVFHGFKYLYSRPGADAEDRRMYLRRQDRSAHRHHLTLAPTRHQSRPARPASIPATVTEAELAILGPNWRT